MIITIGRQHGSSGREIARLLAKELGIKCYDKEIVDEAAKHSDFSRELINAYDEKRMSAFLLHAGGYGLNENFFKEIDASVKRNCRTQNDIQSYLFMYQGFSNDLMMLMGNLMQWKFRMPSIFKKALYGMTQKTVHDVCTKTVWKADDVHKTAATVRQYKERLGYSEQWMTDYVYNIVLLAKKEPKRKNDDTETKK